MKFAWIEETVEQEVFEHLAGEEMLDEGDVPFDPPMYYIDNVSFDPPQYETVGTGSGPVTGINRGAIGGEKEGTITPQHLIWAMHNEAYEVINNVFTAKSAEDVQVLKDTAQATRDAEEARLEELENEKKASGLEDYTPTQIKNYIDNMTDMNDVKLFLKKLAVYVLK